MAFKITKGEQLEVNGIVTLLYGNPSAGKTSTALTASKPILFDFDGGAQRSGFRVGKDIVRINAWKEISSSFGTLEKDLAQYDTIIIDTVETCLDYIRIQIENEDYKMKSNKLQMYGRMKDEFHGFLGRITKMNKNVVLIAHSATEEQNGVQRTIPKITGGSKDIVFQKADFIGFMRVINNKRTIDFNPTDYYEGKNSAKFQLMDLPDYNIESSWFQSIVDKMKEALQASMKAQEDSVKIVSDFKNRIDNADINSVNNMIAEMAKLPVILKKQVWEYTKSKSVKAGWTFDEKKREFSAPIEKEEPPIVETVVEDEGFDFN